VSPIDRDEKIKADIFTRIFGYLIAAGAGLILPASMGEVALLERSVTEIISETVGGIRCKGLEARKSEPRATCL
jgi:dihydrodipicolinate synthase/N-acetylneuraminate lyase